MAYFIESFMENRRKQWLRSIEAVEVKAIKKGEAPSGNGPWYRGVINEKKIEGDTLVIMATFPELDDVACTITASQIIDVCGEIAAYHETWVNKNSGQGSMIKITIPIYEVVSGGPGTYTK